MAKVSSAVCVRIEGGNAELDVASLRSVAAVEGDPLGRAPFMALGARTGESPSPVTRVTVLLVCLNDEIDGRRE